MGNSQSSQPAPASILQGWAGIIPGFRDQAVPMRQRTPPEGKKKRLDEMNPLFDKPWRKIKGWDKSSRDELRSDVIELKPELRPSMDVKYLNILLAGQIGAGKSSFCNSVHSLIRGQMMNKAQVGSKAVSLTKHYRMYQIRETSTSEPLGWRICDTMGLEHTKGIDAEHILAAVDGKLHDKSEISDEMFKDYCTGLEQHPELPNKAHCVAVVVDASMCTQMGDGIWSKLKKLRDGLLERQVPVFILLTKIDKLCPDVNDDITLVYRSKAVRRAIESTSKKLDELPESQIFPIKNYKEELEFDKTTDILLLYAVRHMLYAAKGYIEDQEPSQKESNRQGCAWFSILFGCLWGSLKSRFCCP